MATTVRPIPEGYRSVTPYLHLQGAADAIDFYKRAFRATEVMRMTQPDGRVGHAELMIGDSMVMLADESPEMGIKGPRSIGGTPVTIHIYVEDVDATVDRAVAGGAKVLRPIENQFYGDRSGQIEDPYGHKWGVATHVEDVPPEEMEKRAKAAFGA